MPPGSLWAPLGWIGGAFGVLKVPLWVASGAVWAPEGGLGGPDQGTLRDQCGCRVQKGWIGSVKASEINANQRKSARLRLRQGPGAM